MLLAKKGHRVLVIDRATFPSDILSTHYIQIEGVTRLREWGLIDTMNAQGCRPVEKITMFLNGEGFSPPPDPRFAGEKAYCPRRTVLDKILVDAAGAAGAEVREGVSMQDLLFDGDTVVGVRARGKDGADFEERAKIVVGADGMHSRVAKIVGAPAYNEHPSYTCAYYSYFSGTNLEGAELHMGENGGILAFPTNDNMDCIAVGKPNEMFDEYRSDIEGNFLRYMQEISPAMYERVRNGKREERWWGTADVPNFFRKPFGPGWALVGDAGYHRDPITGLGINDAFRDAVLLSTAIDDGLRGRAPMQDALTGYEEQRNAVATPMYEFTVALASGNPPEELYAGLIAMREEMLRQAQEA
jgi:2-polyprenyl-6-methoxyphenol hydroxylase-like FAD-dependent oxidoreductase